MVTPVLESELKKNIRKTSWTLDPALPSNYFMRESFDEGNGMEFARFSLASIGEEFCRWQK